MQLGGQKLAIKTADGTVSGRIAASVAPRRRRRNGPRSSQRADRRRRRPRHKRAADTSSRTDSTARTGRARAAHSGRSGPLVPEGVPPQDGQTMRASSNRASAKTGFNPANTDILAAVSAAGLLSRRALRQDSTQAVRHVLQGAVRRQGDLLKPQFANEHVDLAVPPASAGQCSAAGSTLRSARRQGTSVDGFIPHTATRRNTSPVVHDWCLGKPPPRGSRRPGVRAVGAQWLLGRLSCPPSFSAG